MNFKKTISLVSLLIVAGSIHAAAADGTVQYPFSSRDESLPLPPPVPSGIVQIPPSSSQVFSWDVRLHETNKHQFLELDIELRDVLSLSESFQLNVTLTNLQPDLSLDTPVPLNDYWANPKRDPSLTMIKCNLFRGAASCKLRKVCNLPSNSSRWFILVESSGDPNAITSYSLSPNIRHVYLHPLELSKPLQIVHNPSTNDSIDFARDFDFFQLVIPMPWFSRMPFGTFLKVELSVVSPADATLDAVVNRDSLPSPLIFPPPNYNDWTVSDHCNIQWCIAAMNGSCRKIIIDHSDLSLYGVWYFAILPKSQQPNSVITYMVQVTPVEPQISIISKDQDIYASASLGETQYYRLPVPADATDLSSLTIGLSDIIGGNIQVALVHNALPLWHQEESTSSSVANQCVSKFSCNLFVDVCQLIHEGVYVVGIRVLDQYHAGTPVKVTLRATFHQSSNSVETVPAGSDSPSLIEPGQLKIYDVDLSSVALDETLYVELYTPVPEQNLTLSMLKYPSASCFETLMSCQTLSSASDVSHQSSSCFLEIPPCRLEQNAVQNRIRLALSWKPQQSKLPLEYTLRMRHIAPSLITHHFLHREVLAHGQMINFQVSPLAIPSGTEFQVLITVSSGSVVVFQKYRVVAGDIPRCSSYDQKVHLKASTSSSVTFNFSSCSLEPPASAGIYFAIRGDEPNSEVSISGYALPNPMQTPRDITEDDVYHDELHGVGARAYRLTNLGSDIGSATKGLLFFFHSSINARELKFHVMNTDEIACRHRGMQTFSCVMTNGFCSLFIPPCFVKDQKWIIIAHNDDPALSVSYDVSFTIHHDKSASLASGASHTGVLSPMAPKHFDFDVGKLDYENEPATLVATVYTESKNTSDLVYFYGLAPHSGKQIRAGPFGCYAHDASCSGIGGCTLLINSFELKQGKYRFAAVSHSRKDHLIFTVKMVLMSAKVNLAPALPHHASLSSGQTVFFTFALNDSIHNPNVTANKIVSAHLTSDDAHSGLRLSLVDRLPTPSHAWGSSYRCIEPLKQCSLDSKSACNFSIEYCHLNPQRYWLMVEETSQSPKLRDFSVSFLDSVASEPNPLLQLPIRSCAEPPAPLQLRVADGDYTHFQLDWPTDVKVNFSELILNIRVWNVSGGSASLLTNLDRNLATATCASDFVSCVSGSKCSLEEVCVENLRYFSVQGHTADAAPVKLQLSACFDSLPVISVSEEHESSSLRAHRQSQYNAAKIVLDARNISAPHLTVAIDDVRGHFQAHLQTSLCDKAQTLRSCASDAHGGCLLELSHCDLALFNSSTFFVVVVSEYSRGEFSILAEVKSMMQRIQPLQLGISQTFSLAAAESQAFLLTIPAFSPPINDRYQTFRMDVFLQSEGADEDNAIEAALTLSPHVPSLPSSASCGTREEWYQLQCIASSPHHPNHVCMSENTCSLKPGGTYVLLVRNKLWKFRATPPIIPSVIIVQVNLTADAEYSVMHIDAPETSRNASSEHRNEIVASFSGLSQTQSLVLEFHSDNLFDVYISRITPAGSDSSCYSSFDSCQTTARCERQYFGCDSASALPSTLYFDIEPLFGRYVVSSRGYIQSPAPVIVNTPVTSQSVGRGIYRHYTFALPSGLTLAYELGIEINSELVSSGIIQGYLSRDGEARLAGDSRRHGCLSSIRECESNYAEKCRIKMPACGEQGIFSLGITSIVGPSLYSLEVKLLRINTTAIPEGHTVAHISSPDSAVVRQIYSHVWNDPKEHNFLIARFSGVTGRITVKWAINDSSCTSHGHCVAHSTKECEMYIPPGVLQSGATYFIVDSTEENVRFHIDLYRDSADVFPARNSTSPLLLNNLYRTTLVLGDTQLFRVSLSPENVTQSSVTFLLDYVRGGDVEAWVLKPGTNRRINKHLCSTMNGAADHCRLELPRCPTHGMDLTGEWFIEIRATNQPHAALNVSIQVGLAVLLLPDQVRRLPLHSGAINEIVAVRDANLTKKESSWKTFSWAKFKPENVLFVYDIPGTPNPLVESWELHLQLAESVPGATLLLSFDNPGNVCPQPLAGQCVAARSTNQSCSVTMRSCQMKGHTRLYAWIIDWNLSNIAQEESSNRDFVLGQVQLKASVDHSLPILSEDIRDSHALLQQGSLLPGSTRFYVIDLSKVSLSFRLSLLFKHNGNCSDVSLLSSIDNPPDDPAQGCGARVCSCSGCLATLEGCSASIIPSRRIILGVQAHAIPARKHHLDYEIHFSFYKDAQSLENLQCYSSQGPRWFSHNAEPKRDELLLFKLLPCESAPSPLLPSFDSEILSPVQLVQNLLAPNAPQNPNAVSLYLSSRYSASQLCHEASCYSVGAQGCDILWRCDSPSDTTTNLSLSIHPHPSHVSSYYVFSSPVKVFLHQLVDKNAIHVQGASESREYPGEYAKYQMEHDDSLLLIRVESRTPMFVFYTQSRVNHGCGDETCVILGGDDASSCWMILGSKRMKMKGHHFLQLLPFMPQTSALAVVNATELQQKQVQKLSIGSMKEYQVRFGDFIALELETSPMNFSASLMPANYSVQLYGAPAHLYRAWITRDAPGSPRVAISGFEFEAQLDINIAKIDFSAIIGKKIFLNLYMSVAEETEAVHSLAVRCSIGSSSRSPIYEDKIEEKQSIHVTLMPGYRKRFVWKPQEVDLDDYDVLFAGIFNQTGGKIDGKIIAAGPTASQSSLAFSRTSRWTACNLGYKLSSQYLVEFSVSPHGKPTRFDFVLDKLSPQKLKGGKTKKTIDFDDKDSTEKLSSHAFALFADARKANSLDVNVGYGNDVALQIHPFDSAGCVLPVSLPSHWNTLACASGQSCAWDTRWKYDLWQLNHSGISGFYVFSDSFATEYSLEWRTAGSVCETPTKRNSDLFCSSGNQLKDISVPFGISKTDDILEGLDSGARRLADEFMDRMACPEALGVCRPLSQRCRDQLNALACYLTYPNCDTNGFSRPVCSDACLATELACNSTFEAVGLPEFSCTRSSRFARRTIECADTDAAECVGCARGSDCRKILSDFKVVSCDDGHSTRASRRGYIWIVYVAIGIASVVILLLIGFWASRLRLGRRGRFPLAKDEIKREEARAQESSPLLRHRGPLSSSSYESISGSVEEPYIVSVEPSAPPHDPAGRQQQQQESHEQQQHHQQLYPPHRDSRQ